MEGWIKLYRKFSEWEWFNVSEMVHLFIYLLLNANHEEGNWRGINIKRGQILTGLNNLNEKTGISIRTLRTCLDRLEKTKEIDRQTTNKYSIITICNYESYQGEKLNSDKHNDKQTTSNRQATDKQPTTNNNKENKKNEENEIINYNGIVENFHLYCDRMAKVSKLSEERKKHISARFKEFKYDVIIDVLKKAGKSDFLSGKNGNCWKADFDWIFNPTNFLKIMEGKYDNKINGSLVKIIQTTIKSDVR